MEGYTKKFKEVHGEADDALVEPIDPEVAMLEGGGLQSGQLWVGGGSFHMDDIRNPSSMLLGRAHNML